MGWWPAIPSPTRCASCATRYAEYRTYLSMPWSDKCSKLRRFTFYETMGFFTSLSMAYWFLPARPRELFASGWEHARPTSLCFCFSGCSGVTTLELTGLDPSTITRWGYAFANMVALTTIMLNFTWELPIGMSSSAKNQCYCGSKSLVGGNGTAFDSSKFSRTWR